MREVFHSAATLLAENMPVAAVIVWDVSIY